MYSELEPRTLHIRYDRSVDAFTFDRHRSELFYVYTIYDPYCRKDEFVVDCFDGADGPHMVGVHLDDDGDRGSPFQVVDGFGAYDMAIDPRAPGDYNLDDKVDLFDFSHFQNCVTAPLESDFLPGCAFFDSDPADRDIDLMDFASFKASMSADAP